MRRPGLIRIAEAAVLAMALALPWLIPPGSTDLVAASSFFVALLILGLFDVLLPRGDAADVGGALAIGAVLLLNPGVCVAIVVGARVCAHVVQKRGRQLDYLLGSAARRAATTAACSVLAYLLGVKATISHTVGQLSPTTYAGMVLVALCFVLLELVLAQLQSSLRHGRRFIALVLSNLPFQGWLLAAQVSVGLLSVLVFRSMTFWGLALVVLLLVVMRQAFVLLLDIRQAYHSTIEVLARAMEAQTKGRLGHAERVRDIATLAGRSIGLHGSGLESLQYAAMLHDVGAEELSDDQAVEDDGDRCLPSDVPSRSVVVVENVEFLADVVPILRILETPETAPRAGRHHRVVSAYIVSRASDIDDARAGASPAAGTGRAEVVGALLRGQTRREVELAILSAETLVYRTGTEAGSR
jgi:hypothetical protein